MPDGTKTQSKPRDGRTFVSKDGSSWIWDGLMEVWTRSTMNAHSYPTHGRQHLDAPDIRWDYGFKVELRCECGNKENPIGQGHSHWCQRFRQEFK